MSAPLCSFFLLHACFFFSNSFSLLAFLPPVKVFYFNIYLWTFLCLFSLTRLGFSLISSISILFPRVFFAGVKKTLPQSLTGGVGGGGEKGSPSSENCPSGSLSSSGTWVSIGSPLQRKKLMDFAHFRSLHIDEAGLWVQAAHMTNMTATKHTAQCQHKPQPFSGPFAFPKDKQCINQTPECDQYGRTCNPVLQRIRP